MNIYPSCEKIKELAESYDLIPVCRELNADMITPITLLRRIAALSSRYFLLESIEGGENWGRYSFLGYDPSERLTYSGKEVRIHTLEDGHENKRTTAGDPYRLLRSVMESRRSPRISGLPSFTGGLVGYFSYSMIQEAEPKLKLAPGEFPDFDMMMFDKVIAYDHLRQKITVIVNMKTDEVMKNYGKACMEIESISAIISQTGPLPAMRAPRASSFSCGVTKEEYCETVEKTKRYIREGDIFQAVISRRFTCDYEGSLINAYRVLRTTNPSPYMVCLSTGDIEVISASPETLVRLQNGRLTTFPVAGSRPRGNSEQEDKRLEQELLSDEKELAEHNMLVDLGRNDLGRVSRSSTVEVTSYKMIHKYSRIMHICSQVEGDIRDDCDGLSAIRAVLPAGTLSGAPKFRACQIIEELEREPRGIYGGAIGYLDFAGNMDTCIAIRMAVKRGGKVYVQAGGGIVADSVPEKEYEESGNKARAVMDAVEKAWEVND